MRPQKTKYSSIEPASGAGPVDCFEHVLSRNLIGINFQHQKRNEFAFPGNRGVLASTDAYRDLRMVRPREHMKMYAGGQFPF